VEARVLYMRILIDVLDSASIERGAPALYAVNYIAFFEQQAREVSAILACDTGNQRDLVFGHYQRGPIH
jgi:hypothetical protein